MRKKSGRNGQREDSGSNYDHGIINWKLGGGLEIKDIESIGKGRGKNQGSP